MTFRSFPEMSLAEDVSFLLRNVSRRGRFVDKTTFQPKSLLANFALKTTFQPKSLLANFAFLLRNVSRRGRFVDKTTFQPKSLLANLALKTTFQPKSLLANFALIKLLFRNVSRRGRFVDFYHNSSCYQQQHFFLQVRRKSALPCFILSNHITE